MKSIALKLWTAMVSLVVAALVLLWFFQIVYLEDFYTEHRVNEIRNKAAVIVNDFDKLEKQQLENALDAFQANYNLNIELVDYRGSIIYSNSSGRQTPVMMQGSLRESLFYEILTGKALTVPLTHPRFASKYMLIGLPVWAGGEVKAGLFVNMPLAPVQDTVEVLKKMLVYISLIMLIASGLLSLLLSRGFTRPILDIKKAAEEMASGNLAVRLKSSSRDEIGQLAQTINHLGEELAKIEQLRKDLIANVSHELRTPLSLIRGYAETIKDVTGESKEKREKQLGIVIEEAERLGRVVDDILNLSQMQSGYFKLNITEFDLNETLQNVVNTYNLLSEQRGVRLTIEIRGNSMVIADEARIEQVLYNLINNAFNHTSQGDCITIRTDGTAKKVKVEVIDSGEGISAQDISHVWDRYYKTEKLHRKRIGTGLGLAIVKAILESHGSGFGVESEEGKGANFWFELERG